MSYTVSPNMNLPIPDVGIEPGPDYADDVNNALTLVDQHDHTSGNGVQITPSGLNINANLEFNSNFATQLAGLTLTAQLSTPGNGTVYESGVDLYYVDGLGNNIAITANGGVAGTPGSIANLTSPASASYVSGSSTFVWQSNTNIAANMDCGSVLLRNLSPNSTYAVTLSPPAALSQDQTVTFPNNPASTGFVTMTTSGTLSAATSLTGGIVNSMIADSTILNAKFAAGTQIPIAATTKLTTYTALTTDGIILASTAGGAWTLTLYSAAANPGLSLKILKTTSDVSVLTIAAAGGQTIDGASTTKICTQYEAIELVSDGSNWKMLYRQAMTQQTAYTPTLVGFGTAGTTQVLSYRSGQNLHVWGFFTAGTTTAVGATMTIGFAGSSANVSIDTATLGSTTRIIGNYASGTDDRYGYMLYTNGATAVSFGQPAFVAASPLQVANGDNVAVSSTVVSFQFSVPIVNWKSSV